MKFSIENALVRVVCMVRRRPVEIGLVATFIIYGSLLIWEAVKAEEHMWLWWFAFTAAYILNDLTRSKDETQDKNNLVRGGNTPAAKATETKTAAERPCGKLRWIYWLVPLAAIALWWCPWDEWGDRPSTAFITAVFLCPVLVLLYRWRRENQKFVDDIVHWVGHSLLAAVLAGVAHLLVWAIYASLHYFFPSFPMEDKMQLFFALVCWSGIMPLTFLTLDNDREEYAPGRFVGTVVNWVITPALLIYTAILYAYFLKITFTWTLPEGGIAWMVFIFTMVAVAVKAFLPLLEKQNARWFYDRFSLISLPALVMFWIGLARRVSDYGLTEPRIYLIVCGVVMSFTVLMFLVPRVAKYRYGIAGGALLVTLLGFVPGISSQNLAMNSQTHRLAAAAERLGIMGEDGKLRFDDFSLQEGEQPDKDMQTVRDALLFIAGQTTSEQVRTQWGVDPYNLPKEFDENDIRRSIYLVEEGDFSMELGGYKTMCSISQWRNNKPVYSYEQRDGVLTVQSPTGEVLLKRPLSEILERQLAKAGIPMELSATSRELLEERFADMMLFEDDSCAMVITSMSIEPSGSAMQLKDLRVEWLLLK